MGSDWRNKHTRDAYLARVPQNVRDIATSKKEATVSGSIGIAIPKPMWIGKERGTEERPDEEKPVNEQAISVGFTAPAGDGHTHEVFVDCGHGNGTTSFDGGHQHDVKSFRVAPYQHAGGLQWHNHEFTANKSALPTHEPTPPYGGEL